MNGEARGISGELDPIWLDLLSAAIAAPSPLNSQPWSVEVFRQDTLDLYIDSTRLLPRIDPLSRQAHISCGAFLENLALAARHIGYRADITLFPGGWPGNGPVTGSPVARVELAGKSGEARDPLFSSILHRRTCREPHTTREVHPDILSALAGSQDQPFVALGYATDVSFRQEAAEYLEQAARYQLADDARLFEILSFVAIASSRNRGRMDGYGFSELGLPGFRGWLVRLSLALRSEAGKTRYIRDLLVRVTRLQARSAAGYGWITTRGDERHDQVRAGRGCQRVCLMGAAHGLCIQPMTQILEPYEGMEALQERFLSLLGTPGTHTVQVLFRFGYGDAGGRPVRRPVYDLIRRP